ncbi:hypothetical protein [Actinomadura livida]|uniref:Uncharacterized protein n=1 Tax=Actinomadura livida TaxID=79909 RepID=A0A7W7IHF9_9ACTN|nr:MULTISPECIES: hypothetical protein [Actinomadura]MBB4777182.1 hypothetical protein [Actinomadura catellatispora]GGU21068.1 hypothetical protein GCM10010208_52640 [Actinomadura livida]
MKGFARREFQLVLLRRMADYQPGLVEDAVRGLGASRTEMREANARWQRILRSRTFPRGLRRYEAVLGPAAVRELRIGDVSCDVARWPPLTLWPGLAFEIVLAPDGSVVREWLVRDDGVPVPRMETVDDLVPWSCVVGDVSERFEAVTHQDGDAPSRWHATLTTPDGTYVAHFVWGLLQVVAAI